MNRSTQRIDDSHDSMMFQMQGTEERDAWMRTFPHPLPATHELVHEWTGPMTLIVKVREKAQTALNAKTKPAAAATAARTEAPTVATPPAADNGADAGGKDAAGADATDDANEQMPPASGDAAADLVGQINQLKTLKIEDLRTRAAELDIEHKPNATKAHLIAMISAKLEQQRTEDAGGADELPAAA